MQSQLPLYPEQASNFAPNVDALMVYITAICLFFAVAITAAIILFLLQVPPQKARRNRRSGFMATRGWKHSGWSFPLLLALTMFAGGAVIYVDFRRAPMDTLDIYVIGKQWMWKSQQPNGLKEINELHVPVGRNVKLIMASEDVIHNFSIPGVPRQDGRRARATTTRCGSAPPRPAATISSARSIAAPTTRSWADGSR